MSITAAMVKDLREKTAAGMMDCKKALTECDGDMEKAVDWLRQKGLSKAAKKAGRATSEGLVALSESADGKTVAIASVQCETDFVSRGDDFKNFVADAAKSVVEKKPADAEALQAQLGEGLTALIAKTGENMKFGPFCIMEAADNECIGHYLHTSGKLGVLVSLACGKPETAKSEEVKTLGREIAMQVAALKPMALDRTKLDPAAIEREREVYREKARNEGKPDKIIEKIAEGRVWTGETAKELGLVDELGGIDKALDIAVAKVGIEGYTVVSYPEKQDFLSSLLDTKPTNYVESQLLKSKLGEYYQQFGLLKNLQEQSMIQARIPFELNIK